MVWGLLCDGRNWNYDELRDKLRLRDRDLNAALGWLARAPERIDDPHTRRQFLDKYEIHPGLVCPQRHSVPRRRRHSGISTHGLSD